MAENLELYVENVASYINDEDKLVTYKWLSKELEIHVNLAKEVLQHYYDSHKNNVIATYLIKGQLKDGSLRMEVTRESDLKDAIKKFESLDFQHIYSVQKALPDIELLATAGNGDIRFSAIKLEKNPLRNEEICAKTTIESKRDNIEKIETKHVEKKAEEDSNTKNIVEKSKNEEKELKEKKEETKNEDKTKITNTKAESTKNNTKTKKPVQSTKVGFNNLFGKVANQKKIDSKIESKSLHSKVEKKPSSPVKEDNKITEQCTMKNVQKSPKKSSPPKVKPKVESKSAALKNEKSKKRTRSPNKNGAANKRKRIVVASDSSDDEEMKSNHSEEEEPEEIIETPQRNFSRRSPSLEPLPSQKGKVKIRKVVSRSYKDEDGFIVTRQETVIEEVDAEPEPAPKPKKVEQPAKVKKQASITNFFKRS